MPSFVLTVDIPSTQSVTPGTSGSPGVITRDGSLTIVLVGPVTVSSSKFVQLPSGASVGDLVEVYYDFTTFVDNAWVLTPSGETFVNGVTQVFAMNRFRKINSTQWGWLKGDGS